MARAAIFGAGCLKQRVQGCSVADREPARIVNSAAKEGSALYWEPGQVMPTQQVRQKEEKEREPNPLGPGPTLNLTFLLPPGTAQQP